MLALYLNRNNIDINKRNLPLIFSANRFWVPSQPRSNDEQCPSLKYDYGRESTSSLDYKNCSSTFSVICKTKMSNLVSLIKPPLFSCNLNSKSTKKKRETYENTSLNRIKRESSSKI